MSSNIVGLIIGLVVALITIVLILWGNKSSKVTKPPAAEEKLVETPQEPPAPLAVEKPVEMPAEDDLVIIEGIGPKVAAILKQNGIHTFAQLADAAIPVLQKILADNGLGFLKPDSWPAQSRLAAEGKMDELKAMQDKLVAGR